jgi:hypothetical protein
MGNPGLKCAYCGAHGDAKLVRDHVVPRSRGGPDNAFNIVIACEGCNTAKRDATAIEWLGDRCPAGVRDIEDRVNARLGRDFRKRDAGKKSRGRPWPSSQPPKLYAFTWNSDGVLSFVGEVVGDDGSTIRIEVVDVVMYLSGFWELSGELRDVDRSQCRIFTDMMSCVEAAERCALPIERERPPFSHQ